jgi:hypothetical protein
VHGGSAISPENRDPIFPDRARKPEILADLWVQKGSPAKRTGHTLRVAAQYIQKTPKNNGLFGIWLAEFGGTGGRYTSWATVFSRGRSRGCIDGSKRAWERLIAPFDQEVLHHTGVFTGQDVAVEHRFSDEFLEALADNDRGFGRNPDRILDGAGLPAACR